MISEHSGNGWMGNASLVLKLIKCSLPFVVQSLSHVDYLRPHELQHARPPCPSPSPRACLDSCPLSWWCHPTISSSVASSPFALNFSQYQGLFQWVPASGGQGIGASASVLPVNNQELMSFRIDWWFCLFVCFNPKLVIFIYFWLCWVYGMAHGVSCPTECGIFPDQGWNLHPLHQKADS